MTTGPLTIIAITTAAPGKEEIVEKGQLALVEETLKEEGCAAYKLLRSLDDPSIRVFVESWTNEALWRAHMDGAAMKRFQASAANEGIVDFKLHRLVEVAR